MKKYGLLYSFIGFAMMGGLILPSRVSAQVVLPTHMVGNVFHADISGVPHNGTTDGIYQWPLYRGTYPDTSVLLGVGGANNIWNNMCRPLSGTDCVFASTTPNLDGFAAPLPDGDYWMNLQIFHNDDVDNAHAILGITMVNSVAYATTNATTTHFNNLILSTTTQTVRFTGYISPSDSNVHLVFNVSTPVFSQWNTGDLTATTTGYFDQSFAYQNFGTSTIDRFTFTGTLITPRPCFSDCDTQPLSHVYDTISTSTSAAGIGVTNIPTPNETILAVAANCNPLSSSYNISSCVSYLFFPDPAAVSNNAARIRDTLLTKAPIGYFTRLYSILTATGTTTIPSISYTWQNDGGPLAGKTLAFNVDDYMVQAKTLTGEMVSNTDHKTAWEIFEPFINTFLAIFVLYAMIHDVMGLNLIHNKR